MTASTNCPSCAGSCPPGSRFCPACGAALELPLAHALERKIVSVLFCDLVGYTALCERLDPEDADSLLRDFYTAARRTIENYGGLVEKFIGDAAVGVFGIPAAHEDDAERAVRAALRLRDELPHLPRVADTQLAARIGVNTGLAVVRHDVAIRAGEGFLVGDAINTAARFQQLAPPGGIVVGQTTGELTEGKILYEPLPAASLKGKRRPVPCLLVRGPVSRRGVDPLRRFAAPLIDREVESGILRGLLEKASASGQPQLALIVGEAGIGKSRLVAEFFRYVENRPQLVRWRQGSCPSYGEGLAFWALGEIVKAELGVLDSDDGQAIETKLARGLADLSESEWLAARLRPLLGLPSPPAARDENYAAWGRFLASLAADTPAVVVFEDLHHASESTLDFLLHLVEQGTEAPLLVIGTARPEQLANHPEIVTRAAQLVAARRLLRIDLAPLSAGETGELVDYLLGDFARPPETRRALATRAAGNALFAEQLAFHLRSQAPSTDQAELEAETKDTAAVSLPASLQTLIAARLDELPAEEKTVLGDAAVVGQVFWTGAIAALDHGDRDAAEQRLAELARRDLVHPERDSTLAGEPQFAFHHSLIREVAYEQLPRVERAAKHAAVARWIETTTATDEAAEIVAHHYSRALDLAKATCDDALTARLREPAVEALKRAGDRALGLDVESAERHYATAASLAGDSDRRPYVLAAWAEALEQSGRLAEAVEALDEGMRGLQALGDLSAAKATAARSWYAHWLLADGYELPPDEPAQLADEGDASPELIAVLEGCADRVNYAGQSTRAIELAERAIGKCAELQWPEPLRAIDIRGDARCALGDVRGLDDLRHALELARERGAGHWCCVVASNLGECLNVFEGPASALQIHRECLELARRHRDELALCFGRLVLLVDLVWDGRWDEALREAGDLDTLLVQRQDVWDLVLCRATHALLLTWIGDFEGAAEQAVWLESKSGESPLAATRAICLITLAAASAGLGRNAVAVRHLSACTSLLADAEGTDAGCALRIPEAVRLAMGLGRPDLARRLAAKVPAERPFDAGTLDILDALLRERGSDYSGAAHRFSAAQKRWAQLGVPYERGQALLGLGRNLLKSGQTRGAAAALAQARGIFSTLGARSALAETVTLLERRIV